MLNNSFFLRKAASVGSSPLLFSPCWFAITVVEALDAIEGEIVQEFFMSTLVDFSCCHWNAESATVSVHFLHLELLPPLLESTEHHILPTGNKECSVKHILSVKKFLKWKVDI
jgi:hypothetical protein